MAEGQATHVFLVIMKPHLEHCFRTLATIPLPKFLIILLPDPNREQGEFSDFFINHVRYGGC